MQLPGIPESNCDVVRQRVGRIDRRLFLFPQREWILNAELLRQGSKGRKKAGTPGAHLSQGDRRRTGQTTQQGDQASEVAMINVSLTNPCLLPLYE